MSQPSPILERLEAEITKAMKARDQVRLGAVRLIKSTVKNKEIELIHPLSETEFFAVLQTMAKQVAESIDQFTKGGRTDLADKEKGELAVLQTFLPQALSDSDVAALIDEAITASGAKGPKDMGGVMKHLKDKTAGRVDGKKLADLVKAKLSNIS